MSVKSEHIIRQEHFRNGYELGVEEERERIIALLESRRCSENEQTHNCLWLNDCQADYLIALIKGENNG